MRALMGPVVRWVKTPIRGDWHERVVVGHVRSHRCVVGTYGRRLHRGPWDNTKWGWVLIRYDGVVRHLRWRVVNLGYGVRLGLGL